MSQETQTHNPSTTVEGTKYPCVSFGETGLRWPTPMPPMRKWSDSSMTAWRLQVGMFLLGDLCNVSTMLSDLLPWGSFCFCWLVHSVLRKLPSQTCLQKPPTRAYSGALIFEFHLSVKSIRAKKRSSVGILWGSVKQGATKSTWVALQSSHIPSTKDNNNLKQLNKILRTT